MTTRADTVAASILGIQVIQSWMYLLQEALRRQTSCFNNTMQWYIWYNPLLICYNKTTKYTLIQESCECSKEHLWWHEEKGFKLFLGLWQQMQGKQNCSGSYSSSNFSINIKFGLDSNFLDVCFTFAGRAVVLLQNCSAATVSLHHLLNIDASNNSDCGCS